MHFTIVNLHFVLYLPSSCVGVTIFSTKKVERVDTITQYRHTVIVDVIIVSS